MRNAELSGLKNISILGSTGSIGQSTLSVVEKFPDLFKVVALAAGNNLDILEKQVRQFRPAMASVVSPLAAENLKKRCDPDHLLESDLYRRVFK